MSSNLRANQRTFKFLTISQPLHLPLFTLPEITPFLINSLQDTRGRNKKYVIAD
ncbi:MAG: hypothetical protein AB2L14_09355 [Candidatus Xenobiia bacterium LiM19]